MSDRKPDWADEIVDNLPSLSSQVWEPDPIAIATALRKAEAEGMKFVINGFITNEFNGIGIKDWLTNIAAKIEKGEI